MARFETARIDPSSHIVLSATYAKFALVHPGTGNQTWVLVRDDCGEVIVRGAPWTFPHVKHVLRNGFREALDEFQFLQQRVNDWWVNKPATANTPVE